jgi:hypothetical protein
VVVVEHGVVVGAERVEGRLEAIEVPLELLGPPPRAAVLEPDGHLARLQAELPRQLRLALRLQLVLLLEAPLQQMHLHVRASWSCLSRWLRIRSDCYLLWGEPALLLRQLLVVVLFFEELVRRGEERPLYAAAFLKTQHRSPTFIKQRNPPISTRESPTEDGLKKEIS